MKFKLIIFLIILCAINQASAQKLDVSYKRGKAYADALTYGLNIKQGEHGKYGFANTKGKFIIRPVFDEVSEFKNNMSIVKYNGKIGVIALWGSTIVEPEYDEFIELTYKDNAEINVKRCIILKNTNDSNGTCLLFEKQNQISKIDFQKHIHCNGNHFFITEEKYSATNIPSIYGTSVILDKNGSQFQVNALSDLIDDSFVVFKSRDQWLLFNTKSGEMIGVPNEYRSEIPEIGESEVIFRNKDNRYYVFYNKLTDGFDAIETFGNSLEKTILNDYLVLFNYWDTRMQECSIILRKTDSEIIATGVEDISYGEDYIDLHLKNRTKTRLKKDGTLIATGINSSFDIKSNKYIITDNGRGYGISDIDGNVLVPSILRSKEDIVIENGVFNIHGKAYNTDDYRRADDYVIIFASSDGWYKKISPEENDSIAEAIAIMMRKKGVEIDTLKVEIHPRYKSCYSFSEEYSLFEEETFNDVTYTQRIDGIYNIESENRTVHDKVRDRTYSLVNERNSQDAYIITRTNQNNKKYLKVGKGEFSLEDLARKLNLKNFLLGGGNYLAPSKIAFLSNGKAIFRCNASGYDTGGRNCTLDVLYVLNTENSKIEGARILSYDKEEKEGYRLLSGMDGFYLFSSHDLIKYSNDGELLWKYGLKQGDFFSEIDENKSHIIITGYNTEEKYYAKPNPMIVLLDKGTGKIIERKVDSYIVDGDINHYWTSIATVEDGYLLQRKNPDNNKNYEKTYITTFVKYNP